MRDVRIAFAALMIVAFGDCAFSQDCAVVTMQDSAVRNTTAVAQVSIAGCRQDTNQTFVDASVRVESDSTAAKVPVPFRLMLDGAAGVQVLAQDVGACTAANLKFTIRYKLRRGSEAPGAEEIKTITKPLVVCPFQYDIQVTGLSVTPSPAGQDSLVTVTVANQGAKMLSFFGSATLTLSEHAYSLGVSSQEDTTGLVRNSCTSAVGPPTSITPPGAHNIAPGGQQSVLFPFRFPQAGTFNLKASASMIVSPEDGPITNNFRTQTVNVSLPPPLVCQIEPVSGQAETFTIKGNWFRRFNTTEVPLVAFSNNIAATGVQVVSPLELRAQFPGYACMRGPLNVTVTNSSGVTSASGLPVPGPLAITKITTTELGGSAFDMHIHLANFRPNCAVNSVTLTRLSGQGAVVSSTPRFSVGQDQITIRLNRTTPIPVGPAVKYIVRVITPYGTAAESVSIGPVSSGLPIP